VRSAPAGERFGKAAPAIGPSTDAACRRAAYRGSRQPKEQTMNTIIAATDGSSAARAAVDRAVTEAAARGARLELVSAWSVLAGTEFGAPAVLSEDVMFANRDAMSAELDAAAAVARAAGVDVTLRLVDGEPAAEICRAATETRADLVIMGSRGHGRLASAVLGSVASRVIAHAPCPVMVVPARVADHAEEPQRLAG
jgi:nucleotide-binding universal stress UspA family protein